MFFFFSFCFVFVCLFVCFFVCLFVFSDIPQTDDLFFFNELIQQFEKSVSEATFFSLLNNKFTNVYNTIYKLVFHLNFFP